MTKTTAPPRYKIALLTWAAAFPVLTTVNLLLGPVLMVLPLPGRTLLVRLGLSRPHGDHTNLLGSGSRG